MNASHTTIFFLGMSVGSFCCLLLVYWARWAARSITEELRRKLDKKPKEILYSPDDFLELFYHDYPPPLKKGQHVLGQDQIPD